MERKSFVLAVALSLLISCSLVSADIIDWDCDDDGDGAIVMDLGTLEQQQDGSYELNISGDQYDDPAHVDGFFTTDTPGDPTVWIIQTIDNATDFDWTAYNIDIGMDQEFQIVGAIAPPGWSSFINQPISGQALPSHTNPGTGWVGSINFNGGPAISIGESVQFIFGISFLGSVAFCTEQEAIPEPATVALLGIGACVLLRRRRA